MHSINPQLDKIINSISGVGGSILRVTRLGFCDPMLYVGFHDKNYLMMIKLSSEEMTNDENDFLSGWHGQCSVVFTPKDALNVLGY